MDKERPKQILDNTFRHLDQVLEEMKQERMKKDKKKKVSASEVEKKRKNNPGIHFHEHLDTPE